MPDFLYERRCAKTPVCGVDEAGRGPLAGPVVAAAVFFPDRKRRPRGLDDSKVLSHEQRETLYARIRESAVVGVGMCDHQEIDQLNIYHATMTAMARAVSALPEPAAFALIDGNARPAMLSCACETIIGGDGKSVSIAAASIIAKVTRDRIMIEMDAIYPGYGFASHKGYGCPSHKAALTKLGPTPIHRRSFAPVRIAEEGQQAAFAFGKAI